MEYVSNPELKDELLEYVREHYDMATPRSGLHGNDLIYCLTKAYWQQTDPLPVTENELILFSIGFGFEGMYLPKEGGTPVEMDGIWFSPDAIVGTDGVDLKTTRMWKDKDGPVPKKGIPEGWIKQFKGYALVHGKMEWTAAVLYIASADFEVFTLHFTVEELADHWQWMLQRKEVLEEEEMPTPYKHLGFEGECKNCRYLLRCFTIAGPIK